MTDPRALFLGGDVEGALAEYDRAIAGSPGTAALLAGRAAVRLYKGDREGCRADVDRAIELDARCSEARLLRARLVESRSRLEAIAEASRAVEADPANTPALYWRAIWRGAVGDVKGARKDFEAIVEAAAPDPFRLQVRGQARLALGAFALAVKDLDAALAGGVTLPFVFYARAQAKSRLKDRRGAIEDLTRVLERTPGSAGLLAERGRERELDGDAPGARADYDRAIELDPNLAQAHYYRGGPEDLARAGSVPVSSADGHYFRGLALEAMGRRDEAGEDYARALEMAPINHPRRSEIEERARAVRPAKKVKIRDEMQRTAPATWVILGACVVVWLLQGAHFQQSEETMRAWGAVSRGLVWEGDSWRLITAVFLHWGAIHLFMNVAFGFSWCSAVEKLVGTPRFVLAYLLSGIGASAVSVLGQNNALSAGASGALFGAIGMVLSAFYVRFGSLQSFFEHPPVRSILKTMIFWFFIGLWLHFDNYAHFGGLVFGLLFGLLFMKAPLSSRPKQVAAWIAVLILLAGTTVAACIPHGAQAVGNEADEALRRGDSARAVARYDEAIRRDPNQPHWLANRGLAKIQLGRRDEAVQDLRRALEIASPDWSHRDRVRKMLEALERGDPVR